MENRASCPTVQGGGRGGGVKVLKPLEVERLEELVE